MLIELSVSNFRSFRDKQTFSMVAAPRLQRRDNLFSPDIDEKGFPSLLKVVAIYGPNASGKSNLLEALGFVRLLSERQPNSPGDLAFVPFRFDASLKDKPSNIEIHFISDKTRYQFEVSGTRKRITHEKLISYPKGRETFLYSRDWNGSEDIYEFGQQLEGDQLLFNAWKNLTNPQMMFISQAVANSSENLKQLRAPLAWLQRGMSIVNTDMNSWASAAQRLAQRVPSFSVKLSEFLQKIDVPVVDIKFDELPSKTEDVSSSSTKYKTTLTHTSNLGLADFDFAEESSGTKNLVGFWLPWSIIEEREGSDYKTMVVDEFDSSLHPKIVENLVSKHLKSGVSAQLIFTTHDTHLMDAKLLRRDQFWLTERDQNGATNLRSIHEFVGRDSEDIEKRYYEGRYRSLPILGA